MEDNGILEDYYAFSINGNIWYCSECFSEKYFYGDIKVLKERLENETFTTINGITFDTIHESTVQFESYPHQIIPVQGIYCKKCGNELYAPDESDMRKQRFLFNSQEEQILCQRYVEKHLVFDELSVSTDDSSGETIQYELTFYTYEPLEDSEIELIAEKFYCSVYQCNEEI